MTARGPKANPVKMASEQPDIQNLIRACRRALRWFERCNQPGDIGPNFLNATGFVLADAIELDLNAALMRLTRPSKRRRAKL